MPLLSTKSVSPASLANNGPKATWTSDELDGYSVHDLQFVLGGTFTKAMISAIQIKVAGKIILDGVTGTQLDNMNDWDTNVADGAANLYWHFGDPMATSYYDKHVGDLDLSVVKDKAGGKANMEVTVTYTGATSPTL